MNRHLNIFHFYNSGELQFLENNLSRAFALCIKHDHVFRKTVFDKVLPNGQYTDSETEPIIDLQTSVNTLEGFSTIIGVACSGADIPSLETEEIRETASPITDVSVCF